jgi:hypothetical protein
LLKVEPEARFLGFDFNNGMVTPTNFTLDRFLLLWIAAHEENDEGNKALK